MKQLTFLIVLLVVGTLVKAQQYAPEAKAATYAYAKGDDSYLVFSDKYDPAKKYVVIKFYNDNTPLTEQEKTDLAFLTKFLQKKNAEVVTINWKDEASLQEAVKKYNMTASSNDGKHLNLKSGNSSLNTTSSKAIVVLEDNKPLSLCSGTNCEDNVKRFFKLQSRD